ncbi:putative non-specific protein-tyrosine kinase RLK-Pelle-RLCK-XV family [Helianthus annuus]|nr:putative non-specific protein-tyrosine kinase RLK-Pelle-RLCK-XV family [Helianthus annuus]
MASMKKLKNCFCCTSQDDQEPKIMYAFFRSFNFTFFEVILCYETVWIQLFDFNLLCSPQKNRDYPWNMYTLKELVHATNNFHNDNKIGEGGFGSVYWGRTSRGAEAIFYTSLYHIKRLKSINAKAEMEFAVEVEILGRVQHKNLLGLKGFHAGGDERLIVYDYMPNHSLLTHLHGKLAADCLLDWPRRMSIAIGSAEGLA